MQGVRIIHSNQSGGRFVVDILDADDVRRETDGDWHVRSGYSELGVFNGRSFIGWHKLDEDSARALAQRIAQEAGPRPAEQAPSA